MTFEEKATLFRLFLGVLMAVIVFGLVFLAAME